jgi:hypothetical protein
MIQIPIELMNGEIQIPYAKQDYRKGRDRLGYIVTLPKHPINMFI